MFQVVVSVFFALTRLQLSHSPFVCSKIVIEVVSALGFLVRFHLPDGQLRRDWCTQRRKRTMELKQHTQIGSKLVVLVKEPAPDIGLEGEVKRVNTHVYMLCI